MILFPAPPRRLRRDYTRSPIMRSAASVVALPLLAIVGGLLSWWFAADLRHEQAIWAHGVPATHVGYEGTEVTQRGSKQYTFDVTYVDQAGRAHRGLVLFNTARFIDHEAQPEVRYEAGDPDAFAVNVAVNAASGRWESAILNGSIIPFVLAVGLALATWRRHRPVKAARRCAKDGRLVVLDLVFQEPFVLRGGKTRYDYLLTRTDGSTHRGAVDFAKGRGPLYVAGRSGKRQILALESTSRRGAVLVLRDDLYPLDVAPGEAERIAKEAYEATAGEGAFR